MQFIFTCSSGDIAFCDDRHLEKIINVIRQRSNKTFLIQSKDPKTFNRAVFPQNVILGSTLETNRDELAQAISKAPMPSHRYKDFLDIKHDLKMVTIEPVMDFDMNIMVDFRTF